MGVHRPEDIYKIALYDGNAHLNALTTQYTTNSEVRGKGYKSGGATLEGYSCGQEGTSAYLSWERNPVWPVATIKARGALIYNASRENKAIMTLDFPEDVISTNGRFEIPLPECSCTAGMLRLP